MAKPQAPLLSLGASGTIAKTLTYARWKGRAYVKHHVAGKDPRTPAQALARDTFRTGDALWVPAPALFKAPWDRFATGQVKSGYNAWLGRFVRDNLGRTDLLNLTFSPGAAGGLATSAISLTPGPGSITVDFTNPAPPIGWTLESAIAAAIRDGDPASTTLLVVTAAEDTIAQLQVVLNGLTAGASYVVGAWLRWRKPDGSVAYGPSLPVSTATPAAVFTVNAVHFDGTNDWLTRGAPLTGAVDGENLLLSLWFNLTGGDGVALKFFESIVARIQTQRNTGDNIQIIFRSPTPTILWNIATTAVYNVATNPGWHNLLIAAQLDLTPVAQIYIDDVAAAHTEFTAPTNGDIDWTETDYAVGAAVDGNTKLAGDLAELYSTNEYLDISVLANRRKFIDAAGKPVDLGPTGSLPTGTAPLVFFSGPTDAWHTNKGSGGGFTENGALTDAATSPSD